MKVPASIYSALFAVVVMVLALLPASGAAEMANEGAGECEALSGGIYYNFTTEQFCDPAGAAGGGTTGGGGSGGASGGGGGSTAAEPLPGLIVIHDPVQGGTYCGSFADAFVDRPQDCLNRGVKTNCSPVDGCFKCPEEGCIAGHPAPNRGQRPKEVTQNRKPQPKMGRLELCHALARDYVKAWRDHRVVPRLALSLGFTWQELYSKSMRWRWAENGTVVLQNPTKSVAVAPSALPDGFFQDFQDLRSKEKYVTQMLDRNSCNEFRNLVKESDIR